MDQQHSQTHVLCIMYLSDGTIDSIHDVEVPNGLPECGDVHDVPRDDDSNLQIAVVMGCAKSEFDAVQQARQYFRRLCKWDHVDSTFMEPQFLFGHNLCDVKKNSQVDIFTQLDTDGTETCSSDDERTK